jgi:hypothetical protein
LRTLFLPDLFGTNGSINVLDTIRNATIVGSSRDLPYGDKNSLGARTPLEENRNFVLAYGICLADLTIGGARTGGSARASPSSLANIYPHMVNLSASQQQ